MKYCGSLLQKLLFQPLIEDFLVFELTTLQWSALIKYHIRDTRKNGGSKLEKVLKKKQRFMSKRVVYATLMFPNFNKWKERKTFRMVQLDQNDWAFLLETLNAAHYGVNNDSSG